MRKLLRSAALVLSVAAVPVPAHADDRTGTYTDVGVFTAIVTGTHVSSDDQPESGVIPGAALEVTQHLDRVRVHFEGIPTVGAGGSNVGPYGHDYASLDLLNSTVLVDIDAHRRFRMGFGYQLINLTNKSGITGNTNDVRIGSPILAFGATLPLRGDRFLEVDLMDDPNLRGNLLVFNPQGVTQPTLPEQGAEVDYSVAYGWRRGRFEYLVGGRGISYHTKNINDGSLVDRNVGGGLTFEVRYDAGK
jgi:hypothetical protein